MLEGHGEGSFGSEIGGYERGRRGEPGVSTRLAAKEINKNKRKDFFAETPPLEAK